MTDPVESRFRQAVDKIDDQAAAARTRAHDPSVSRTMQQAHLHRATALTRAVRELRAALADDQPAVERIGEPCLDLDRLVRDHVPNTPRTHDAQGRPVNEPPQCEKDLQAWPCDVKQLLELLETKEWSR